MCIEAEWINKDNIEMVSTIATVVAVIITAIALCISINQFKKQLQLTFFSDYTKRYQEICLNFPESINQIDFDFETLPSEIKDKTLRYMRAYFDLCSEEYFLHKKGSIDDDTWKEWKSGIEYAFSKTAFRKGWEMVKLDTRYYPEFVDLVKPLVIKST